MKLTDTTDLYPVSILKIPYYRKVDTYYKQWEKACKFGVLPRYYTIGINITSNIQHKQNMWNPMF